MTMEKKLNKINELIIKQNKETNLEKKKQLYDTCNEEINKVKKKLNNYKSSIDNPKSKQAISFEEICESLEIFEKNYDLDFMIEKYNDFSFSLNKIKKDLIQT